jgi:hypothetical protein
VALQITAAEVHEFGLVQAGTGSINLVSALSTARTGNLAHAAIAGESIAPRGWVSVTSAVDTDGLIEGDVVIWGHSRIPGVVIWGDAELTGNVVIWGNGTTQSNVVIWGHTPSGGVVIWGDVVIWGHVGTRADVVIWGHNSGIGNVVIWGD